jgi:hypothetical protein
MPQEFHLSDQELLMAADGELSVRKSRRVEAHLAACWSCRARRQELESTIGEFVRFQHETLDSHVPLADGPRALLKAQLRQLAENERTQSPRWVAFVPGRPGWAMAAAAAVLIVAGTTGSALFRIYQRQITEFVAVTVPNPSVTPGATVLLSQQEVCREGREKNRTVSKALQKRVLAEYGIPTAEPEAYEIDYLITPALGGADDIHNLWPESNRATLWNAQAKDALEDYLRVLVCDGQLDLGTAQREIAGNWIEAYKKYFHTDRPRSGLQ